MPDPITKVEVERIALPTEQDALEADVEVSKLGDFQKACLFFWFRLNPSTNEKRRKRMRSTKEAAELAGITEGQIRTRYWKDLLMKAERWIRESTLMPFKLAFTASANLYFEHLPEITMGLIEKALDTNPETAAAAVSAAKELREMFNGSSMLSNESTDEAQHLKMGLVNPLAPVQILVQGNLSLGDPQKNSHE